MSKTQNVVLTGEVVQVHVNAQFSVKIPNVANPSICYLASKISRGHAKPTVGDTVEFEVYPQDVSKGRIIKVLR